MKKLLLMAITVLLTGGASLTAFADCWKDGQIIWVRNYQESQLFIVLRTGSLTNHFYFVDVPNTEEGARAVLAASTYLVSGARVQMRGDAPSCPTAGAQRNMGTLQELITAGYNPEAAGP